MKKYLNILAITAGASLVGAVSAQAQLIAYDGFNYPQAAPGTFAGSNGGSGDWNGAWTDKNGLTGVIAPLTYTGLPTAGNSISAVGGTATSEAYRSLNHTFGYYAAANTYGAGTLWMSYLWAGDNTGTYDSASGYNLFRQATMGLYQGTSEYGDIGMPNISAANAGTVLPNVSLWVGHGTETGSTPPGSTSPIQSGVALNNFNTDFILVEFLVDQNSATADTINVWVNPTIGGTLGTPDMTYANHDWSGINAFRISANSANSNYGGAGVLNADEVRLGWTANAVETMSVANVVPEPASMALLGLGSLGLLLFRRKK